MFDDLEALLRTNHQKILKILDTVAYYNIRIQQLRKAILAQDPKAEFVARELDSLKDQVTKVMFELQEIMDFSGSYQTRVQELIEAEQEKEKKK